MTRPPFIRAGETFNRLTALEDAPRARARIMFRCACGTEKIIQAATVKIGRKVTRSCGCLKAEVWERNQPSGNACRNRGGGGYSKHPLYETWRGMMARTSDPRHNNYRWYGGRGITVCDRWQDVGTFCADLTELLGPRPDGCTLDRIDNNGDYEPGNVRWATAAEQNRNKRRSAKQRGKRKPVNYRPTNYERDWLEAYAAQAGVPVYRVIRLAVTEYRANHDLRECA